ncbi:MAG: PDZ domain-containing protein [Bryobacterales bacterium]|nr:PDZ domain-containing protein [Bryobacterales bacterium]
MSRSARTGALRRGQVGVVGQTITPAMAEALTLPQAWGVILADVTPKSPAEAAGLQPEDIVLTLDGKVMENARQFGVNIYQHAGDTITLEVAPQWRKISKRVAVLERPRDPDRILAHLEGEQSVVAPLGILAVNLSAEVIPLLPPLRRFTGVVVAGIIADLATDENSLRTGDVIYELNNRRVGEPRQSARPGLAN